MKALESVIKARPHVIGFVRSDWTGTGDKMI